MDFPSEMKAWVLLEPGKLALQQVPVPIPNDWEVLIRIDASCICNGSDPGIFHGHEAYSTPMIFGHEASGVIVQAGKNSGYQEGERVSYWCAMGAFAEYQAVDPRSVAMFRVPPNLPVEESPVIELVIASCRALMKYPAQEDRKSLLICGMGPSGLVLAQYARMLGYQRIIGWDLYESRRKLALSLGVDEVYNPAELTREAIAEISPADIGVLMMGDDLLPGEPTATMVMRCLRDSGLLVSYGHPEHGCRFNPFVFQSRNLTMVTPENNLDQIREKGQRIMQALAEGKIQIKPLITHCRKFEELGEAFQHVLDCPEDQIKVIFQR
ncbi:MAG: zinc-dependent alcohol dehydrogenase [Candidatus Merdivicinus sp.]|jgi:L-iditol 2-dehydrogenase